MTKHRTSLPWYRQCQLRKLSREGCWLQWSWIPEKYARYGEVLKLWVNDGWDDGWKVVYVGQRQREDELPKDYHLGIDERLERRGIK